ncbi:MAG TPA: enoyl-CoA hydratase/isomerase family protein [Conexibacter sp.]|nr:enoyl-CoA hydratase/isomerase family protein [Conexibacter sp.]
MISQTLHGDVAVVRMDAGQNCFRPSMLDALGDALDAIEQDDATRGVVLTGTGKVFSYGLDIAWMAEVSTAEQDEVVQRAHDLLARVLSFPLPTVAAINGHAFGAGAMLALACDERTMRADRGWFCLPEVDFGLPFTAGMATLIRRRLSPRVAHEAMVGGRRYGGVDAQAAGIVEAAVPEELVVASAVDRTRPFAGKGRPIVQAIKRELYGEVLTALAISTLDRELLPEPLRAPAA